MPNFLFPTNATETLEQTLGNATIAANTSVETAQSVGYGVALTGASAIDAFTAKNTYSRCMFGVGCGLGAAGTVSSALTAFNISVGLGPVAMVSGAAGTAFYWLGRKVNALGRVGDIPAV